MTSLVVRVSGHGMQKRGVTTHHVIISLPVIVLSIVLGVMVKLNWKKTKNENNMDSK
jgi:hypothetical protein